MTPEDALGYPPVTLEDFVMARLLRFHLSLVGAAARWATQTC